jgi:predicted flap endonuclease-1-like 5' DNA nuclease
MEGEEEETPEGDPEEETPEGEEAPEEETPEGDPEEETPEGEEAPEEEEPSEPDDLTAIPGIGPGRAKKLYAAGLDTFGKLMSAGTEMLAEIINVDEDTAEAMISAAGDM